MLSVPLAGMIFDYTQSYDIPYIIYSLVGFLGAFSEGLLPKVMCTLKKGKVLISIINRINV